MSEQIAQIIREEDHFLLTSHVRPDGDAICSSLALRRILEELGKTSRWVLSDDPPSEFSFLYRPDELEKLDDSIDLEDVRVICALDLPDWTRTGDAWERLAKHPAKKICLDHHPRTGSLTDLEMRDTKSSATTVLVYRLLRQLNHPMSLPVAKAIYTGLLTDTMSFHLANTNREAHEVAAECLSAGVNPAEIYEIVYGSVSFSRLKLTSLVLATLAQTEDGRVTYLYATRSMYEQAQAQRGDDEDLVEYARSLEGTHIALFLRELENNRIRISWRSRGEADVAASARHFGGGGHVRAAGADVPGPLERVLDDVIAEAQARLNT